MKIGVAGRSNETGDIEIVLVFLEAEQPLPENVLGREVASLPVIKVRPADIGLCSIIFGELCSAHGPGVDIDGLLSIDDVSILQVRISA